VGSEGEHVGKKAKRATERRARVLEGALSHARQYIRDSAKVL
jgi:hypothetical protein